MSSTLRGPDRQSIASASLARHSLGNIDLRLRLDLIEIRQRLTALRSLHSHDQRITSPINTLMAQIGHLKEPESCAHEKALRDRIALTFAAVDKIASGKPRDRYIRSGS